MVSAPVRPHSLRASGVAPALMASRACVLPLQNMLPKKQTTWEEQNANPKEAISI